MSTNLRIGGLATGMDIDQMVSDLMKANRVPLDSLNQEKQRLEWKQQDYRTINLQLSKLRESAFNLGLEGTLSAKTTTSSDSDVVTATAGSSAVVGSNSVVVTQIAKAAHITSSSKITVTGDDSTLASYLGLSGTYSFTINGVEISVDADTEDMGDLIGKINSAVDAQGDSVGVQASYDSTLQRVFLNTTDTGAAQQIDIDSVSRGDELFAALNININTGVEATGADAVFTLNGTQLETSSNNITINGVTYHFQGVSAKDDQNNPIETSVMVRSDEERVFNLITDFVDLYNETIAQMNDKLSETFYRDYPPLTDDQRSQLDDDQIKQWTDKAKSGLLRNDAFLNDITSQLRLDVSGVVKDIDGSFASLADIGITTGAYYERGILHVDEDKLRGAIAADFEGVRDLFASNGQDDVRETQGVAERVYSAVVDGIADLTSEAGLDSAYSFVDSSVIGKSIKNLDKSIDETQDRLDKLEDRYWQQFSALEQAVNRMNQQSAWLAQQFGIGNSGS